ncbi:hypothetical protein DMENIID0001_139150 [Sergentomyia squamirostris]
MIPSGKRNPMGPHDPIGKKKSHGTPWDPMIPSGKLLPVPSNPMSGLDGFGIFHEWDCRDGKDGIGQMHISQQVAFGTKF